jgi:hypothetical protein
MARRSALKLPLGRLRTSRDRLLVDLHGIEHPALVQLRAKHARTETLSCSWLSRFQCGGPPLTTILRLDPDFDNLRGDDRAALAAFSITKSGHTWGLMFQHFTTLLSFIFAIALTHVFACVSELIQARERVRFYGLHALWMFNASLSLFINWLFLDQLESLKHWSLGEIGLQVLCAVPQYFTCSLSSMKVPEHGQIDMRAFYEHQRAPLFSAFIILYAAGMFENYADRNNLAAWTPDAWIGANLAVLPMLIA